MKYKVISREKKRKGRPGCIGNRGEVNSNQTKMEWIERGVMKGKGGKERGEGAKRWTNETKGRTRLNVWAQNERKEKNGM